MTLTASYYCRIMFKLFDIMFIMIEFKIKEIRKNKHMSVYRLSKYTGIAISYLRDLENNKKFNPSLLVIYKIALALNVKIEDLFTIDLNKLRLELNESIDNTGIESKETLDICNLLNMLINIELHKK